MAKRKLGNPLFSKFVVWSDNENPDKPNDLSYAEDSITFAKNYYLIIHNKRVSYRDDGQYNLKVGKINLSLYLKHYQAEFDGANDDQKKSIKEDHHYFAVPIHKGTVLNDTEDLVIPPWPPFCDTGAGIEEE